MASRSRARAAAGLCAAVLAAPAAAGVSDPDAAWDFRVAAARSYALARAGVESFGVADESGRLRGYHVARVSPSASVLKAMLLVAYLRRASVRDRALASRDRSLLAPMIRWSDNVTAGVVLGLVGPAGVYRLADRAGMRDFRLRSPWGLSEITPRDQARYFRRIDVLVPARHRRYARYLLRSIVPSQRWGIAAVRPPGWALFFKGGWASGTGRVTHQVGLVKQRRRRVALAILTEWNPSHLYGTRTVRGIAARLLRGFSGGSAARIAPAGAPGVRAWSASSDRSPGRFDAYVRAGGAEATRVNPAGTRAIVGGLDGTRLAYTELRRGASSIRVVDTATGDRVALPAGVNTRRSEWAPSLSGDRLLFGRVRRRPSEERVLLADLAGGGVRVLARAEGDAYVQPGKVAGDFAVWVRCRDGRRCRVVRRNLATGVTVEVPNPGRRAQFAPSVTAAGTVYFAEASRLLCGRRVRLWRYARGVRTRLAALPRGTDVARTDAGAGVLLYDRYDCGDGTARIASLAG